MTHPALTPQLFCPECLAYLGPAETSCQCGWQRPVAPAPAKADQPLWRAALQGACRTRPFPGGSLVLCAMGQRRGAGALQAFDMLDGAPRWPAPASANQAVEGGLAAGAERVYFASLSRLCLGEGAEITCIHLPSGRLLWRRTLTGSAWSPPLLQEARLLVACGDTQVPAQVHCLELSRGERVPGWPLSLSPGRIWLLGSELAPYVLHENGGLFLLQSHYGNNQLIQVADLQQRVSSPPELKEGWLVYALEHGGLAALNLRSLAQHEMSGYRWLEGSGARFPAQPLIHQGRVVAGGHDKKLHCWDLSSGAELWSQPSLRSISCTPAVGSGLAAAADNGGRVYAFDEHSGEPVWSFDLDGSRTPGNGPAVFSGLAHHQGVFLVGDEAGQLTALPWHLGHYRWAAARKESQGLLSEAAELYALSAHQDCWDADQRACYLQAAKCWKRAGEFEKAAALMYSLEQKELAANLWFKAGERWRNNNPARAARCYQQAAAIFWLLRSAERLSQCNRRLARCAHLPYIRLEPFNMPTFIQDEEGQFSLRLTNDSAIQAPGPLRFCLGGALQNSEEGSIQNPFTPRAYWTIPLNLVATQEHSVLVIELSYATGHDQYPGLNELLEVPITARPPRQTPLNTGSVGVMHVTISSETAEGLKIDTRNVGVIDSDAPIDSVTAERNIGVVDAHQDVGEVKAGGKVGSMHTGSAPAPAGGRKHRSAQSAEEGSGESAPAPDGG